MDKLEKKEEDKNKEEAEKKAKEEKKIKEDIKNYDPVKVALDKANKLKGMSEIMSESGSKAEARVAKADPNTVATAQVERHPEDPDENGHEASPIDAVHKADFSKEGMEKA